MGDYTTAIIAMVGIGIVLTAAVVFALMRPSAVSYTHLTLPLTLPTSDLV